MTQNKPTNMVNCLLIGGAFAGVKTRTPLGMKVLCITGAGEINVARSITQMRKGMDKLRQPKGDYYMLETCVVASPTLNDTLMLVLGFPPGEKMSDAFMSVITGYCMMCRPEDYENDDTPVATVHDIGGSNG